MPVGCENLPANQRGGLALGAVSDTFGAWNASIGVRGLIATSVVVRVGLTFHNFGGGSQATTEFSAGVGWKF